MPPPLPPSTTTLVVAATPPPALGIGKNLTLPWPRLAAEMSYFARVTKRAPPPASPAGNTFINAVVMGRKTWDSIPTRFRPLPNRINIIVSRTKKESEQEHDNTKNEFWVTGIEEGVGLVRKLFSDHASSPSSSRILNRIFIIGGAEIYRSALNLPKDSEGYPTRILQTTVLEPEFECDTFFPELPEGGEKWEDAELEELVEYTGEEKSFLEGVKEENGVRYRFGMKKR